MLCLIVGSIDAVWRSLTILLCNEESVLQDGRAAGLGWLLPAHGDGLLGKRFDINMSWLGNTYCCRVCLVKYAICLYIWLFEVKRTWIRHSDAFGVDAVTALEAEGDPVLFANVSLIEGQVDFVDRTWVLGGVNLHVGQDLLRSFLASSLEFLNVSL